MRLLLFDMGLPMIVPSMVIMLIALIPIIFIEGHFISKDLKMEGPSAYQASLFSNIISTLLGIPITWFALVFLQFLTGGGHAYGISTVWQKIIAFTWQAPWLIPYYEEKNSAWIGYAAMIVLLIPYCWTSWYTEYLVSRSFLAKRLASTNEIGTGLESLKTLEVQNNFSQISNAIWKANIITYTGIGLLLVIPLLTNIF